MLGEPNDSSDVVEASSIHGFRAILAATTDDVPRDCVLIELDTMAGEHEWTLRISLELDAADQLAEMLKSISAG